MFINEFDIIIDKIIDDINNNNNILEFNTNFFLKTKFDWVKKYYNMVSNLVNEINKNDIENIVKLICISYSVCVSFLIEKDEKIKTNMIKLDLLDSNELGKILALQDILKYITLVLNTDSNEKLLTLYKTNIEYKNAIDLLNTFGYKNVNDNLRGEKKKSIHNIAKLVTFKKYYKPFFRKQAFDLIYTTDEKVEIIDIIIPKIKILDYSNIENILNVNDIRKGLAKEILEFYEYHEKKKNYIFSIQKKIEKLFDTKLVIPITQDFLRYHKSTEKYDKSQESEKEQTRVKYIINKTEKMKSFYSKKKDKDIDIKNMIYQPLSYRKAFLYNELEEINIINNIQNKGVKVLASSDFYFDLINLRKYNYINFKDINNGFNIRPNKTITAVRYTGIESLNNNKLPNNNLFIDTRIINQFHDGNILGLLILDNSNRLDGLQFKNIKDIRNIDKNGYEACKNILINKINGELNDNYYWIFDKEKDIFSQKTYEKAESNEIYSLMVSSLYEHCMEQVYNKIISHFDNINEIDIYEAHKIKSYYHKKLFNYNNLFNYDDIINSKILKLLPINQDYEDKNENKIYGIIGKIYKLPQDNDKEKIITTHRIDFEEEEEDDELEYINAFCQHSIDWNIISRLRNNEPNRHTELLYSFIKKYVITNNDNQYICKSCKQFLDIQNYLANPYEGGSSGIDIILTSTKKLTDMNEYAKFSSSIKNIEKLVERLAQINNFNYYIGNELIHKYRRQDIVKQVIDMINIHDQTLRTKNMSKRDREIKAYQQYGISTDYTNFFIFSLSNDIFKFSSDETDKFKKIKVNNIIAYILLLMILELNEGQVTNFEFNKRCNMMFFNRVKDILFQNLKLRYNNTNNVMDIQKLPVLNYILYYISCMTSKYKLWYSNQENDIIIQKNIIHTLVDLMNSLLEVFSYKDKNFIYEIFSSKIINKINGLFKNEKLLDEIKKIESKKINIDAKTNKIRIVKSIIPSYQIGKEFKYYKDILVERKKSIIYYIKSKLPERETKDILKDKFNKIKEKFYDNHLLKIAQSYNLNGDKRLFQLNEDELKKIKKDDIEKILKILNKQDIIKVRKDKLLKELKSKYKDVKIEKKDSDKLLKIIENIIKREILINNIDYDLYEAKLKLYNDYLGNPLKKSYHIKHNDEKLKIVDDNIRGKIYKIEDKSNNVSLIYNYYTLHYLGYIEKGNFIDVKKMNIYIDYIPSIKEMIDTLGFKKDFYKFDNMENLKDEIRNVNYNLKNYIKSYKSYINQVKYRTTNQETNSIVKYYINKINKITLKSGNKNVFQDNDLIIGFSKNKFDIKEEFNITNISKEKLSEISITHNKLKTYLISQLILFIEINNEKYIQYNVIFFVLSLLIYFYYNNYQQTSNFEIIRYNYIVKSDLIQEVKSNMIIENEPDADQQEELKEQQITDDERLEALDAEQENFNEEEGGEEVLFNSDD